MIVFMPSDTAGRDRKLAHLYMYHGPFHIVNLMRNIERPKDQSLHQCYPEQSNVSWTGHK